MGKRRLPLARLLRLDRTLRSDAYPTAPSLARDLGVSVRTIQRDIEHLRSAGAPVRWNEARRGYEYADPGYIPPFDVRITEGELLSVLAGERTLQASRDTPFEGLVRRIFLKLGRALPEPVTLEMEDLVGHLARERSPVSPAGTEDAHLPRPRAPTDGQRPRTKVRLRFSPRAAPRVMELEWPSGVELQSLMDGGLELTLAAREPDRVLQWSLQWGREVEVVAPRWGRRRIVQIVREIASRYQSRGRRGSRRKRPHPSDTPGRSRSPRPSPKAD